MSKYKVNLTIKKLNEETGEYEDWKKESFNSNTGVFLSEGDRMQVTKRRHADSAKIFKFGGIATSLKLITAFLIHLLDEEIQFMDRENLDLDNLIQLAIASEKAKVHPRDFMKMTIAKKASEMPPEEAVSMLTEMFGIDGDVMSDELMKGYARIKESEENGEPMSKEEIKAMSEEVGKRILELRNKTEPEEKKDENIH